MSHLFFKISSFFVVYILIYVDIILTSSNPIEIQKLIKLLDAKFSLKDLDMPSFLGIGVTQLANGNLFLNQRKYIMDFFNQVSASRCQTFSPHLCVHVFLCQVIMVNSFDNPTLYRSIIRSLQYATITRLDLAFTVKKVCQYMASPTIYTLDCY